MSRKSEVLEVGIIGGGISGLGSAYHLIQTANRIGQPIHVEIFDKNSNPGGTWSKDSVYEGLGTNNSSKQMHFDDPLTRSLLLENPSFGSGPGGFRATGKGMQAVMESIAAQVVELGAVIRYQTEVIGVRKEEGGERWVVKSTSFEPVVGGAGEKEAPASAMFNKIIIATGAFSTPAIPACALPFIQPARVPVPSDARNAPLVVHTSHLSDETVQGALDRGRREIVIVGASKSALDAAERFATLGHSVSIVLQTAPYLAPAAARTPEGHPSDAVAMVGTRSKLVTVPYFKDPVSRSVQSGGWYAVFYRTFLHQTWLGARWLHAKLTARSMKAYEGWGQWGHEKLEAMRPRIPLMWSESTLFPGPTNYAQLVREDKIKIIKGAVVQMSLSSSSSERKGYNLVIASGEGSRTVFATGVIFGTGWSTGLYPFFDEDQINSLGLPLTYTEHPPARESEFTELDKSSFKWVYKTLKTMRTLPAQWSTPGFSARFAAGAKTTAPYRLYRMMVPLEHLYDRDIVVAGVPTCKANHVLFLCQAHWIADYLLDLLPNLPSRDLARKEISMQTVWAQRLFGPSHGRLGQWLGGCWIEYCSRLCWDMGVKDDGKGWDGVVESGSYHLTDKRAARDAKKSK